MMSLWDALRMNMMISYQELVRTFLRLCQQNHDELSEGYWFIEIVPLQENNVVFVEIIELGIRFNSFCNDA